MSVIKQIPMEGMLPSATVFLGSRHVTLCVLVCIIWSYASTLLPFSIP